MNQSPVSPTSSDPSTPKDDSVTSLFPELQNPNYSRYNYRGLQAVNPTANASASPVIWQPAGRFSTEVFTDNQIDTQELIYGRSPGFNGQDEDLYMTVIKPTTAADSAVNRPVIVALTGGNELGAYCGMTYDRDQVAMREMAKLGYVTVTIRAIIDPSFCNFANSGQQYIDNMGNNLFALNIALNYLENNAQTFGVNSQRIGLYGYSIGGTTVLLKARSNYSPGHAVRAIAALSSFSPDFFGGYNDPSSLGNPHMMMISYEQDGGFGQGVVPHADQDCANFTVHGYPCTYGQVPGSGHPIHANDTIGIISDGHATTVIQLFTSFMRQMLVE